MKWFLLVVFCLPAMAQFGRSKGVISGNGLPIAAQCSSANAVGLTYARKNGAAAGSTFYVCANTAASTYAWELAGTGSGGGATTFSGLLDFNVVRTSGTVLTQNTGCSATAPCGSRWGSSATRYTTTNTATVSAGTGTAWFYSLGGVLTVGHNLTLACSGCTAQSGITGFPIGSVPYYSWTATAGVWDTSGGTDWRAAFSGPPDLTSSTLTITCTATGCTIENSPIIPAELVIFDFATATAVGDGKYYLTIPASLNGYKMVAVSASVVTVGTTNTTDIQLAKCSVVATGSQCSGTVVDMLTTVLSIDSNENKSSTAATPAVIDGANNTVATDQVIRVDVDAISTTPATGLIVTLSFQLP